MFLYLFFTLMDKALENENRPHLVDKCPVCGNKKDVWFATTYHCPNCHTSGITRIG